MMMLMGQGSRQKAKGKRQKAKGKRQKAKGKSSVIVPFAFCLSPVASDFNRGLLVAKSKLWYKGKLIFVKNTHAYRHVW
jgi:hypothetical protein